MIVDNREEFQLLKEEICALKPDLMNLKSNCHWIELPEKARNLLSAGFRNLRDDWMAEMIGFPLSTIKLWKEQDKVLQPLQQRLRVCVKRKQKYTKVPTDIVEKICLLMNRFPVLVVASFAGIMPTTLHSWKKRADINYDPQVQPDLQNLTQIEQIEGGEEDINTCERALNLEKALKRHIGSIRRKYSASEKKQILDLVEQFGSKLVHVKFGVSYDTITRLKRRSENLLHQKPRVPLRYAPVIELMQKHPGMGPMQIRDYIHRHMGLSMGVNSIRKVMEDNGWVPPYIRSPRVKESMKLYEAIRRNYMWHIDFKHQFINKCRVYILLIQDDMSRFIVGHTFGDGEKVDTVIETVEAAIQIHGTPEVIMSDGGSAFYSWRGISKFTKFLEDFGIDQYISKLPTTNGKLENLNQQMAKELLDTMSFTSLKHFEKELTNWVGFYNFQRLHQGLAKRQVPADRYFPGANQWYGKTTEVTKQQSLIAETMATLLNELKKSK
jgi:transposase InsO family protein